MDFSPDFSGNSTYLNESIPTNINEKISTNHKSSQVSTHVYKKLRKSSTKFLETDFNLPKNEPNGNNYKLSSACEKDSVCNIIRS